MNDSQVNRSNNDSFKNFPRIEVFPVFMCPCSVRMKVCNANVHCTECSQKHICSIFPGVKTHVKCISHDYILK